MFVDLAAGGRPIARRLSCLAAIGLALAVAGCARKPDLHRVTIRQFRFEPDPLVVTVGDTIEWTNRDVVPHTASARSGRWDSKVIQPNASWRMVWTKPVTEPYGCLLHTNMQGRVEGH